LTFQGFDHRRLLGEPGLIVLGRCAYGLWPGGFQIRAAFRGSGLGFQFLNAGIPRDERGLELLVETFQTPKLDALFRLVRLVGCFVLETVHEDAVAVMAVAPDGIELGGEVLELALRTAQGVGLLFLNLQRFAGADLQVLHFFFQPGDELFPVTDR
jgi:hypothetical protein